MVDDLDGDAARFGFGEGAGGVAVEGRPGVFVDFGLQGRFQCLVGIVGAQKVGLADEETLLVVVGIDEPAGDAVGVDGADIAGLGVEDIHSVDLDLNLSVLCIDDFDIGFAEDDEEIPLAGILQIIRHVQVGVHAGS